jgi:hypothetical protein
LFVVCGFEELLLLSLFMNLYFSCLRIKRVAYRDLAERPGGKRPPGRRGHRWVYYIEMDILDVGWGHGLD